MSIKKYKITKLLLNVLLFDAIGYGQDNPNVHPYDLAKEFMKGVERMHLFEAKNEVKE